MAIFAGPVDLAFSNTGMLFSEGNITALEQDLGNSQDKIDAENKRATKYQNEYKSCRSDYQQFQSHFYKLRTEHEGYIREVDIANAAKDQIKSVLKGCEVKLEAWFGILGLHF